MQPHAVPSRRTALLGCSLVAGLVFFVYFLLQPSSVSLLSRPSLSVWSKANERIQQAAYTNADHAFCGPCPAEAQKSTAWQLINLLGLIRPKTAFLVNIGAASAGGGVYDPTHPVLIAPNSSFGALLIDPNSDPALFNAYPKRENVQIKHDYIWAESVVETIFQRYQVPKDFALLKIDIDSYECSVFEAILRAGYRPDVIHTEFNPIFPPPVLFQPLYQPETKLDWKPALWMNTGPFYGCSLTALSTIFSSFGYLLLQVEFWDVIYVREEVARSASLQVPVNDRLGYEVGFLSHNCLPYCRKNPKLYNQQIFQSIETNLNQSNFTAKMRALLDTFAPSSAKTQEKHPYLIKV